MEVGAQKFLGCHFLALGSVLDPHSQAHAGETWEVKELLPCPLTKTLLPNGVWEPSVTVYTQLKIPTERGKCTRDLGEFRAMPPETLICHRTQLESGCGAWAATGGNRQVHLAFSFFESVFQELPYTPSSMLGRPHWAGGGKGAQEVLPLGLQEFHSMSS